MAAGAGREEGLVVGHITVDDFKGTAVSGLREGGEVASGPNQDANRVAFLQQSVAQLSS